MKNWELCPKCNGQGTCYSAYSSSTSAICDVCFGKKIINSLTGLPPEHIAFQQQGSKIFAIINNENID